MKVVKVFSTPERPGDAVLEAVVRAVGEGVDFLALNREFSS